MDLYSNAIIVSKKLAKENPKAVKGLIARDQQGPERFAEGSDAVGRRGRQARAADQGSGREASASIATLKDEMNHPEIAKIGLGNVDQERLKKSIDILVDANGLPRTPTVERNLYVGFPAAGGRTAEEAVLTGLNSPLPLAGGGTLNSCDGMNHGTQARRPRCDDHRPGQGHGRGDHQGLRRRRREAGAGRPRHRGDRAGGGEGESAGRASHRRALRPHRRQAMRSRGRGRPRRPSAASTFWSTSPAARGRSARPASRPRRRNSTRSSRST